jgi:AraC family transcriptional regulator
MEPKIVLSSERKIIGKRISMCLADNKTFELWKGFMVKREEITNKLSSDLISLQIYSPNHFRDFDPNKIFEKWAAVEVTDFDNVPHDLETFIIPAGLYAVFKYKGLSTDQSIFRYIFGEWLPNSDYMMDNRPHFELLGYKYKNNDLSSEEDIWIPIEEKNKAMH